MRSKITGGEAKYIFTAKILEKYDVKYYQCEETGFIQTEEPYWLGDAYSSAITKLDLGLPYRNELLRSRVVRMINKYFDKEGVYLDYAGGYGLFTRLMRDQGFNFFHSDKYCENLFAEYFDLNDINKKDEFDLVTAFEVFEHMADPMTEILEITKLSDHILFTTELQPDSRLDSVDSWWYFIPETGQHISLHTIKSLTYIAEKLGYNFYTDGTSSHLFTKKNFSKNPFENNREPFFIRKIRKILNGFDSKESPKRESLLTTDWLYVKSKLSNK